MDNQEHNSLQDKPSQQDDRLRRILKASSEEDEAPTEPGREPIPPTGTEMPEKEVPAPEGDSQDQTPPSGLPLHNSAEHKPVSREEAAELPTGSYRPEIPASEAQTTAVPVTPVDPAHEQTTAMEPLPKESDAPTQPVKVRPPDEALTVPPPVPVTRPSSRPQPLPNRVNQVDENATRVTPAAYGRAPAQRPTRPAQSYPQRPPSGPAIPPPPTPRSRPAKPRRNWGCLLRTIVGLLFVAALLLLLTGTYAVFAYLSIASTLPDVEELQLRASQFETTRILDRNGNVLYEILDPNAGRRTYVKLDKISPYLLAATIATEDKEFWNHPGFDPLAIVRALWTNYTTGGGGGGASTITQQLARGLLLSPQERTERTVQRKAREIILAAEITRRYSKEIILELYLNENYYGNLAYGVEAAAETYFNTNASQLNLAQASFIAGLPQAPSVYDIYQNRDATLERHKQVLTLMYEVSRTDNCIDVGLNAQPVCVGVTDAQQAATEVEQYPFQYNSNSLRYPHWVTYIRALLEEQFDAQTIYRSGFTVYTTLDPVLQDQAQQIVRQQVAALADLNAGNGALVAIHPSTGEILAMVGSADFNNEAISGEINMTISPRQPGSSIKPLTYVAAFEKGWTPSTLIWDVPSEFPPSGDPNDPREPYRPANYDGQYHGPVTVRTALANSYNIPAVKTLQFVGIYDNPNTPGQDGLVNFARRLGISTLNRADYGLSLTLGGGEVTVLEMTSAFSVFANSGQRIPPVAITKISDYAGNLVYEYERPQPVQVVRPEHAYLISSILSDNEARTPAFTAGSVLNLPFQAAVKTGTTNDFRDNWTIGYTPDLAVGVWVGNADYTPMINTTGVTGAAPIWSQFMQFAVPTVTGGNPTPFNRPPGITDRVICSISGTEPSEYCTNQRSEVFASDQLPEPKEKDLWQKVNIDTWTGLKASAACGDFTDEQFSLNVTDPWAQRWIRESGEGQAWAAANGFTEPFYFTPARECKLEDPRPTILFAALSENQSITSLPLDIYAVVHASDQFRDWTLEWGAGDDPAEWQPLIEKSAQQFRNPEKIFTWDLKDVPADRTITLRIYMNSTQNTYAERRVHIRNMVPTATPTPTPTITPTETQIPTQVPTATETPQPTPTGTPPPPAADIAPTSTPASWFPWPPFLQTIIP